MVDSAAVYSAVHLLFGSFTPWLVVIPGIIIGLVFGAIPGLQISMAMAVFLPMTLYMNFMESMLFLTAIFTGGSFGGGVPAILMNMPGTSSAIATAFDGYPMARQGKHNEALGVALGASTVGVAFGYVVLFLLIQPISLMVLKIGPSEMFVVILWGLTLIVSLRGKNIVKGLLGGLVGLLLGTVGYSDAGVSRGTMGLELLLDGIPVVPAMIGLFAASELFNLLGVDFLVADKELRKVRVTTILAGFRMVLRFPLVVIRGSLIGILIGAVPGVGSSVSNVLSYIETKRRSKNKESFGHGNPEGVAASESANSSSEGGSMATLLALGIPGGGATAVMLSAFAMHNITGGPRFIREQTDIVYAIIFANFGQVFLLVVLGILLLPMLASVVKMPIRYLIPSVLAFAVFGSFGLTGNMAGPYTVVAFAIFGYLLKKYDYSIPAVVVGLVLGKMAEGELLHTYQISGGQFSYLFHRPVTIVLIAMLVLSLLAGPLFSRLSTLRLK